MEADINYKLSRLASGLLLQ